MWRTNSLSVCHSRILRTRGSGISNCRVRWHMPCGRWSSPKHSVITIVRNWKSRLSWVGLWCKKSCYKYLLRTNRVSISWPELRKIHSFRNQEENYVYFLLVKGNNPSLALFHNSAQHEITSPCGMTWPPSSFAYYTKNWLACGSLTVVLFCICPVPTSWSAMRSSYSFKFFNHFPLKSFQGIFCEALLNLILERISLRRVRSD